MTELKTYSESQLAALLPYPQKDANKYSRGKMTLVAGCNAFPGAASLAGRAGQRMGAGYTEVITDPEALLAIRVTQTSLVVKPWDSWEARSMMMARPDRPAAAVIGSGFEMGDMVATHLVTEVLQYAKMPILVDGGGLGMLTSEKNRELLKNRYINGLVTVVTPHAGEAERLARPFDLPTEDPKRLSELISLAYGVVCVLKGPDTYISNGEETTVIDKGTAVLAKAGTGDVLAGMAGALLAQGLNAYDACVLAVYLHAAAGRIAAEQYTEIAAVPEDLIEVLPEAIWNLAKN